MEISWENLVKITDKIKEVFGKDVGISLETDSYCHEPEDMGDLWIYIWLKITVDEAVEKDRPFQDWFVKEFYSKKEYRKLNYSICFLA